MSGTLWSRRSQRRCVGLGDRRVRFRRLSGRCADEARAYDDARSKGAEGAGNSCGASFHGGTPCVVLPYLPVVATTRRSINQVTTHCDVTSPEVSRINESENEKRVTSVCESPRVTRRPEPRSPRTRSCRLVVQPDGHFAVDDLEGHALEDRRLRLVRIDASPLLNVGDSEDSRVVAGGKDAVDNAPAYRSWGSSNGRWRRCRCW